MFYLKVELILVNVFSLHIVHPHWIFDFSVIRFCILPLIVPLVEQLKNPVNDLCTIRFISLSSHTVSLGFFKDLLDNWRLLNCCSGSSLKPFLIHRTFKLPSGKAFLLEAVLMVKPFIDMQRFSTNLTHNQEEKLHFNI